MAVCAPGKACERPRRRTGRRTAAAFSSSPLTLLSSPLIRGEVGRGVPRAGARMGRRGYPPRPPFQGGEERVGRRGQWAAGQPPSRPPPFQGGGAQTGGTRERPRRRTGRRTAAFSPPPLSSLLPPFRGEVGRGVRRRRAGWAAGVIPPGGPSRGEEAAGGRRVRPRRRTGRRADAEFPDAIALGSRGGGVAQAGRTAQTPPPFDRRTGEAANAACDARPVPLERADDVERRGGQGRSTPRPSAGPTTPTRCRKASTPCARPTARRSQG